MSSGVLSSVVGDGGLWARVLTIAGIGVVAYILVLFVALLMWTLRDMQARTASVSLQVAAVALVGVFNLPGLLLYFALRPPELLTDAYNRQLEAAAFAREVGQEQHCPDCRRAITDNFNACPYCRASLRTPCTSCQRGVRRGWTLCPYCMADAPTAERAPRAASATGAVLTPRQTFVDATGRGERRVRETEPVRRPDPAFSSTLGPLSETRPRR